MFIKIIVSLILLTLSISTFAREQDFTHFDHLQEMKKREPGVKPASIDKKTIYQFDSPEIEVKVKSKKDKKKER